MTKWLGAPRYRIPQENLSRYSSIHTYIHTYMHAYISSIHTHVDNCCVGPPEQIYDGRRESTSPPGARRWRGLQVFNHTYIHTYIHHTYIHTYIFYPSSDTDCGSSGGRGKCDNLKCVCKRKLFSGPFCQVRNSL